jgi:hypothetical protein
LVKEVGYANKVEPDDALLYMSYDMEEKSPEEAAAEIIESLERDAS